MEKNRAVIEVLIRQRNEYANKAASLEAEFILAMEQLESLKKEIEELKPKEDNNDSSDRK